MRKALKRLLILSLVVRLSITPVYAIGPAILAAGVVADVSGEALLSTLLAKPMVSLLAGAAATSEAGGAGAAGWGAVSALVGLVGGYLMLKDSSDNSLAIPLGDKAFNLPPVPSVAQTVPGSTQNGWVKLYSSAPVYASQSACIQAQVDAAVASCIGWGHPQATCSASYPPSYFAGDCIQSAQTVTQCPSGYSGSGATCTLIPGKERAVQADKRCDILFTNGQFSAADDLDCTEPQGDTNLKPVFRGDKVMAYGQSASGNPLVFTVSPNYTVPGYTDGPLNPWWKITVDEQVTASGQTQVKTTDAVINPSTGKVVSVTSNTAPGSISMPSQVVSSNPTSVNVTNTPIVTTSPNSQVAFPSDYARQGEAAAAANPLGTKLDTLHKDLTDPGTPPTDPTIDQAEFGTTFFKDTFKNLIEWQVPGHTSVCPTARINFTFWGQVFDLTMDAHCALLERPEIRSIAEVSFNVLWSVAALFIILGA